MDDIDQGKALDDAGKTIFQQARDRAALDGLDGEVGAITICTLALAHAIGAGVAKRKVSAETILLNTFTVLPGWVVQCTTEALMKARKG